MGPSGAQGLTDCEHTAWHRRPRPPTCCLEGQGHETLRQGTLLGFTEASVEAAPAQSLPGHWEGLTFLSPITFLSTPTGLPAVSWRRQDNRALMPGRRGWWDTGQLSGPETTQLLCFLEGAWAGP